MCESINIFTPGRLCLFGEHSDWAGVNRTMNPDIVPGCAIVTGIEQGIYATACKSEKFVAISDGKTFESEMDMNNLRNVARDGGFFSYIAGVASYMSEWYHVGGITLEITKMDLPMKSGLSSSAAICVLVAKAFNELYDLHLNTLGIMNIAYWGELRTPSRCGRLDQACAFGVNPVAMIFDGNDIEVEPITVGAPLYFVFADLMSSKDTVRILADLNSGYPFAQNELHKREQEALGQDNIIITDKAKKYIAEGDAKALGELMIEAQQLFDDKVAPMCPSELTSPVLHSVLADKRVVELAYGAKGVGSQGDGTVQFLAKDSHCQSMLIEYLEKEKGMKAYSLTLKPQDNISEIQPSGQTDGSDDNCDKTVICSNSNKNSIKKAIIPVAGFGTRLYPETRAIKKEFCPVVDYDGLVKPGIMVLLEELDRSGIEEICMILNRDEQEYYENFFFKPLPAKHLKKLKPEMLEYENTIRRIAGKITFAYQEEQKGFGHAVYQANGFAGSEPVLLLLGDTIYKSSEQSSCVNQIISAYDMVNSPVIALQSVPVESVMHYGIFAGEWEDNEECVMKLNRIAEKPAPDYARTHLMVTRNSGENVCYAAFGSYILTQPVFDRLKYAIDNNIVNSKGEVELTDALKYVSDNDKMYGCVINGESYDLGNPEAYRHAVANFGLR